MDDSQAQQPLGDFVGHHGRAVIGQESTRQTAFLDRLGESVHEVLGGLREVPLDVAAESRVVVEDAQRDRAQPLAAGSEHLERTVVEIEMPQRPDVLGFKAADLTRLASFFGAHFTGAVPGLEPRLAHPAVRLHVAPDRGIRAERPQRRIGLHQSGEVVVVQLVAPVRVLAVLEMKPLGQRRGQRHLAAVFAQGAAQDADGVVVLAPRCVVPAFDGDGREADIVSISGMRPGLGGKAADGRLDRSARRGRAQQRADDGEAKARPQGAGGSGGCLNHHVSSQIGVKGP